MPPNYLLENLFLLQGLGEETCLQGGQKSAAKDNICVLSLHCIDRSEGGVKGTPRILGGAQIFGNLFSTQKKILQNKQTVSILLFQALKGSFLLAQCYFRDH